jgi:heterodisulfide reductase subunit B2
MADRKYIYYSGCSQEGTALEYDMSLRLVMKHLGADLKEPDDWSCCGSTPAHTIDDVFAAALAARNLSIVEGMGETLVTTPCPSCLTALKRAHIRMEKDGRFKDQVNELLDGPYNVTVTAKSNLQIMYEDIGLDAIAEKAVYAFPDLKVAPYYGCILNRPPDIAQFDDPENPVAMDRILQALGVEVRDFAFKTECCGAAFGVVKRAMVNQLTYKVLSMAIDAGANCIAVACPLCQQNLDLRQEQVNRTMQTSLSLPVLYFTQIMGLAFGYSPKELGIDKVVVSADHLLRNRVPAEKRDKAEAPPKKVKAAKAEAVGNDSGAKED